MFGLFKTEVIHRHGLWRSFEAVEYATLEGLDWLNHRRLLEPIGNVPPRGRSALLCSGRGPVLGSLIQTKWPQGNVAQFGHDER